MNDAPVYRWSARQAVSAMSAGQITAVEYAQSLLERAEAHSTLNAFVTLENEHVLAEARRSDVIGPLAGLPIAFKDAIGTNQLPTTAATFSFGGHIPQKDAAVVASLRAAGAYVFGKLNMHELSYGITSNNAATGPVRNPYDMTRIPGGSSGGAGAAVAASLVPVAIGTDTGGSVRIPAALCGTVGFRPTTGRYSQAGIIPVSHTRDTAGPLARSVDDIAMIDAALSKSEDKLSFLGPTDIRLGLPNNHYLDSMHAETREVFEARLSELTDAGFTLVRVDVAEVKAPMESCGFPIAMWESKIDLDIYLKEHFGTALELSDLIEAVVSPDVKGVLSGLLAPEFEAIAPAYQDAINIQRPALQGAFADCFVQNQLDALIFPTTILPACLIGEDETVSLNGEDLPTFPTFIHNTDPGSIAGLPGISIPGGLTQAGLPVGIELDGPAGRDRHLLSVAETVERHLPPITQP